MSHGQVGRDRRARAVFVSLQTRISSPDPLSMYECLQQLSQLRNLQACKYVELTFLQIIRRPTKLHLLGVFVLAGCWDKFESTKAGRVDHLVSPLEPASLRLAARDKINECLQWEDSLTPTMRAARRGDFNTFINNVHASRQVLVETDLMGHDVFFWAMAGQNMSKAILDYLIIASTALHRFRGRSLLHSALYAAPETVNYIFNKQHIAALVNHRDLYSEDDQWAVCYYSEDENTMAETCTRWAVVRLDRNRMMSRLALAETRQDLDVLATVKFEGRGDALDEQSRLDLDRAKAGSGSLEMEDRSPLHYAAEAGNIELARRLLRAGAGINQTDSFGMTALHVAAKQGDGELVDLLCMGRADCSPVDKTNSRALDVARDNGHQHVQQLLQLAPAPLNP